MHLSLGALIKKEPLPVSWERRKNDSCAAEQTAQLG
jgi:hypothetical protein